MNPEAELSKGPVQRNRSPSQLEESQMDPTTEKSRWQSTMGNEKNGLMQECCDNNNQDRVLLTWIS